MHLRDLDSTPPATAPDRTRIETTQTRAPKAIVGDEPSGDARRAQAKALGGGPAVEPEAPLDQLARSFGIQPSYVDWEGNPHKVSDEILTKLLAIMGVHAGSDAEVKSLLAAREVESWKQIAAPVQVSRANKPLAVSLNFPARDARRPLVWKVIDESGREKASGRFSPSKLPVTEHKEIDGDRFDRHELKLPVRLGAGYHRLVLETPDGAEVGTTRLIVAPKSCYLPQQLKGDRKLWGLAVQLYSLRSERNWGIGDFGDLKNMGPICAKAGVNMIGLNPLHALFGYEPDRCSPYSPSTRLFVNPIYLDVEAVAGFASSKAAKAKVASPEFQARLKDLRDSELVDYGKVHAAKMEVLELVHQSFEDRDGAFAKWVKAKGEPLERYATFEALQEHFARTQPMAPHWGGWPKEYQDPTSPAVKAFAKAHSDRVRFHQFLQWQADVQLAAAQGEAKSDGLAVGLYRDLAVGTDRYGADTWTAKDIHSLEASVGAPRDGANPQPQNWGLPPAIPEQMKASGYQTFIDQLRANMQHAGALRLDHVMQLARLFWLPPDAGDGAYVHYPLDDLLAIVALESQRHKCLVIGEDLGTVPEGFSEKLQAAGIFSYKILSFEREADGLLKPPSEYPRNAAVGVATHDLPTLAGYWQGWDLAWRLSLQQFGMPDYRHALDERRHDRENFVRSMEREGLLPRGSKRLTRDEVLPTQVSGAVHDYLDRTPSRMMMAQLEEVFGSIEQPNLPGTINEHPNWRRKMPEGIEGLSADPRFAKFAERLSDRNPKAR